MTGLRKGVLVRMISANTTGTLGYSSNHSIILCPFGSLSASTLEFGLLREWVVAKIDRARCFEALVVAPCLAPKSLLRKRVDRNNGLQQVRQILIEVCQIRRVRAKPLVLLAQHIADIFFSKLVQINAE